MLVYNIFEKFLSLQRVRIIVSRKRMQFFIFVEFGSGLDLHKVNIGIFKIWLDLFRRKSIYFFCHNPDSNVVRLHNHGNNADVFLET